MQALLRFWRMWGVTDAVANAEAELRRHRAALESVETRCVLLRPAVAPAA